MNIRLLQPGLIADSEVKQGPHPAEVFCVDFGEKFLHISKRFTYGKFLSVLRST